MGLQSSHLTVCLCGLFESCYPTKVYQTREDKNSTNQVSMYWSYNRLFTIQFVLSMQE